MSLLLAVFLCAASFVGGAVFGKQYGYEFAYKNGYATGYLDLAKDIKSATASNVDIEDIKDCKNISSMKWVSVSVCTINGVKTVSTTD